MTLPVPRPGLVLRYSFLWSHERSTGRNEATKDRPAVIVVAVRQEHGETQVIVAPITHEPPTAPADSIAIPAKVRAALGLDAQPQWLRLDELNRFTWPGFDLRPIPGRTVNYAYGMLPRELFESLRHGILIRQRSKSLMLLNRD